MDKGNVQIIVMLAAALWLGGLGYLQFRYPEFFAKLNLRFGLKMWDTPQHIALTRRVGIVQMALASLLVLSGSLISVLRLNFR